MNQLAFALERAFNQKSYHKDVGLPASFDRPKVGMKLAYSNHACMRRLSKPGRLPQYELIEVTLRGDQVYRWVVRFPWGQTDLVLVLNPTGAVITNYINARNDKHVTLRKGKYAEPNMEAK